MTVCPVCQKENPAGVEYCEDCGASLAPVKEPLAVGAGSGANAESAGATSSAGLPSATSGSASPPAPSSAPQASPGTEPGTAAPAEGGPAAAPSAAESAPAGGPAGGEAAPAGPSGKQWPRLLVKRFGALTGDEVPLQGERLLVGRFDPETGPVDIDLSAAPEAEHISRQHAELDREADGRWLVRDLGSTNGVFVKGSGQASFGPRITEPLAIADGDELAFGNARFVFRSA